MSAPVTTDSVEQDVVVRLLDQRYYEHEAGLEFQDAGSALRHYAEVGARKLLDPSPYFDTEFYLAQGPELLANGTNPLEHYAHEAPHNRAHRPNPLFGNGFYLERNAEMQMPGGNPLLDYLETGSWLARPASQEHAQILRACGTGVSESLSRGGQSEHVVFFIRSSWHPEALAATRALLLTEGFRPTFVIVPGAHAPSSLVGQPGVADLGEFGEIDDLTRPSALRLLARSLVSRQPHVVFTDVQEAVLPAHECGVPVYAVLPAAEEADRWSEVEWLRDLPRRLIFPSSEWLDRLAEGRDTYPTNVALRRFTPAKEPESAASFARSILDLARRDGLLAGAQPRKPVATNRVIVLCSDWGLSGVNSAMEAVGRELRSRGWDLELLFTRDRAFVEQTAGTLEDLPDLPYRFLDRGGAGVEAMWQQLIAELGAAAPCIVLIAYDFFGNSVVPALSSDVGVVMWVQADDGDYYEQTYRLGRYCNAVVCVSGRIREQVTSIHPGIGERAHVIHNTSISDRDLLPPNPSRRRSDKLRIVYTGRLVQYQKRVLDFVALADELEALGLDFTIDLIGSPPPAHDDAALLLPQRAGRHLGAGRIRLLGRLPRAQVLEALRDGDLFVLLSDFEGLPLSLVEAMAEGCVPVVAEMKSGISELLIPDESGLVVPGRDYAHWARTIRDLWRDEERLAAMGERAQETVRTSFTVERVAEQFDSLLREVADEIESGYERPPALTWGGRRAPFGDVLPPPPMYRAVPVTGLG